MSRQWKPYGFYNNVVGDHFNIEAVCPGYTPFRDETGMAIVSGYDPEDDPDVHWLRDCGHFETAGGRCSECGNEPPWGDDFDDDYNEYDEELDFGFEVDSCD